MNLLCLGPRILRAQVQNVYGRMLRQEHYTSTLLTRSLFSSSKCELFYMVGLRHNVFLLFYHIANKDIIIGYRRYHQCRDKRLWHCSYMRFKLYPSSLCQDGGGASGFADIQSVQAKVLYNGERTLWIFVIWVSIGPVCPRYLQCPLLIHIFHIFE